MATDRPRRWLTVDVVLAVVGAAILLSAFLLVEGTSAWSMSRHLLRYGLPGIVGAGAVVLVAALHLRRVAAQVGRGVLDRAEGRESVSEDGPDHG